MVCVCVCVPGISPQTLAQMVLLSLTAQPALPEQQPSEILYMALSLTLRHATFQPILQTLIRKPQSAQNII